MKSNRYYLIIGIVSLGLLLIGGTYAWMVYETTVGNNSLKADASDFFIDYTSSLTGELLPSLTDKGGLMGTVSARIKDTSSVEEAIGKLYLYADSNTDSILYQGTELGIALKYSVYEGNILVTSGTVTSDIVKNGVPGGMLIYEGFKITKESTLTYNVYVWLDGELVDNRYLGVKYAGGLNLEAVQAEE